MSEVVVRPVVSRPDKRRFLEFPWSHYRGDPNWVPPLRHVQQEVVGFAPHPFYQQAEGQTFLAWREGRPCGRIAAILNPAHNRQQNERRGFFGFFECEDDTETAHALLNAVRDWFAERDIHLLRGPVNPSLNYECGLLVEGFDSPPTFMMTYNPAYYERLLTGWGFRKAQDLYAFLGFLADVPTMNPKMKFVADAARERLGVSVRSLDKRHFQRDAELFVNLYNLSLPGTWGYAPMTDSEVRHMATGLKHLLEPELMMFAEVGDKAIGAVLALPDYNPRIKRIDGRLFPFGFLRLVYNRRAIKRVRVISINVLPEYQMWGVGMVLMDAILPHGVKHGITEAEFSWVLESNTLSRRTCERGGARRTKVFRIYDYCGNVTSSDRPSGSVSAPA